MTFGNYIYQDNTSQSRQAAVNQLIDTADNLEAGHLKAVETASQLKTTIANLDMNEAEDGFKQQLQADLEQIIENNVQYGNMYYALDDIIKKSGDILSNPAVIGRLKTQQEYKAFRGLYDTDPIVKASINAEIAHAKWAREHGDLTDYGAFDATGNFIGLEQYIKNKFDKIGNAAKYLNQTLTTKNIPSRGSGGSKTSSKIPGANAQGGTKDAGASTSTNNVPKTGNSRAISQTKATTPNPEDVDDINNEQGL